MVIWRVWWRKLAKVFTFVHLCPYGALGVIPVYPFLFLNWPMLSVFMISSKSILILVNQRFLHNTSDHSEVYPYLMFSSLCTAVGIFLSLIMFSWSPKCWMEKSVYCDTLKYWQLFIPGVTYLCWLFFSGDALFLLYTMPLEVWSLKVLRNKNATSMQKGHLFW